MSRFGYKQHHLFAGCKHCIPKSNIYGDARFQHGPIKEKHRNKKTWPDIINVHKYEIPKQWSQLIRCSFSDRARDVERAAEAFQLVLGARSSVRPLVATAVHPARWRCCTGEVWPGSELSLDILSSKHHGHSMWVLDLVTWSLGDSMSGSLFWVHDVTVTLLSLWSYCPRNGDDAFCRASWWFLWERSLDGFQLGMFPP